MAGTTYVFSVSTELNSEQDYLQRTEFYDLWLAAYFWLCLQNGLHVPSGLQGHLFLSDKFFIFVIDIYGHETFFTEKLSVIFITTSNKLYNQVCLKSMYTRV